MINRVNFNMMKNEKGQVLVIVLTVMVVLAIFIPVLVFFVQNENKWAVKSTKSTIAFHCAEAGIDRAYWKLLESIDTWNNARNNGLDSPYDGSYVFTDITGGQYKIYVTTSTSSDEVKVVSIGRDTSGREVRAIQVIYGRSLMTESIQCDDVIDYKPNMVVHWGPIKSFGSIDDPADYFPRKYSKSSIGNRDTDPTPPNTDNKEYWAYEDLGQATSINMTYYINKADSSVCPAARRSTGTSAASKNPAGSGHFTQSVKFRQPGGGGGDYTFDSSTSVIYIEGDATLESGTWLNVEALIVTGDVDFNARSHSYTATVPSTAAQEYVKKKEVSPTYTYPGEGSTSYVISNCGMHGFLYCGDDMTNSGGSGANFVGALKVVGSTNINNFTVYYDSATGSGVQLDASNISVQSWQEVMQTW